MNTLTSLLFAPRQAWKLPFYAAALFSFVWPHASWAGTVYRCPGPPILYTDGISKTEARRQGCREIHNAPLTIVSAPVRLNPAPRVNLNEVQELSQGQVLSNDALESKPKSRPRSKKSDPDAEAKAPASATAQPTPRKEASRSGAGFYATDDAAASESPATVSSTTQQGRDRDARFVLEAELQRERTKLQAAQAEFNNGKPDPTAQETRDAALYQQRVSQLRSAIVRHENDIRAIQREMDRLRR